jgi:hypothetical protein
MARIEIRVPDWLDKICVWPVMRYRKLKYGYSFRKIYLGEGEFTIIEPPDYYAYSKYKWILSADGNNFYAVREAKIGPKKTKIVSLHREIMNAPKGILVDHRNGDGLDNRRENLRLATYSQNNINKPKKANTSSIFRGVCFEKCCQEWGVFTRVNGKQKRIGRFKDEVEAARAYDRAALKYHGEFARLNFPREDYVVRPEGTTKK